jgi:hypothetical protein
MNSAVSCASPRHRLRHGRGHYQTDRLVEKRDADGPRRLI